MTNCKNCGHPRDEHNEPPRITNCRHNELHGLNWVFCSCKEFKPRRNLLKWFKKIKPKKKDDVERAMWSSFAASEIDLMPPDMAKEYGEVLDRMEKRRKEEP